MFEQPTIQIYKMDTLKLTLSDQSVDIREIDLVSYDLNGGIEERISLQSLISEDGGRLSYTNTTFLTIYLITLFAALLLTIASCYAYYWINKKNSSDLRFLEKKKKEGLNDRLAEYKKLGFMGRFLLIKKNQENEMDEAIDKPDL